MSDATRLRRLESEIERWRGAAEDAQAEAERLAAERDALRAELERRSRQLRESDALLREARADGEARAEAAQALALRLPAAREGAPEEELRVTMEELQALAEELETVNRALAESNEVLEARVAERTVALARANAQLRDSEERLRMAQRHAGAGTWDWDIRNAAVVWSEEFFELCGLDRGKVTPSHEAWLELVLPEDREAAAAAIADALRRRDPDFRMEYRIGHPRRGERWLASRGRLVCDAAGDPVRLLGLDIDITDRKRAELTVAEANEKLRRDVAEEVKAREAAQARLFQTLKLEALGQLTGGVAHDFNNLLSVIVSGTSLLRRDQDQAKRERLMDAIEQAARRGADLTRRLLTFARRQALRPAPLDLRHWLPDMRELLARSLRGDIAVEIEAEAGLWPVLVDAGELELAVLNLAVNARDAMPRGGRLRLRAENAELRRGADPDGLEGRFVRLAVQDDGTGMPPEVLAHAFEPFFSTKEVGRGTGLGLAQVYGFARQSGGAARITSIAGQGTAVTLLLPRSEAAPEAAAEEAPAAATARPAATAPRRGPGLNILLVEDDDDVAVLTAEMLHHLGHTVSRVESGAAALKALAGGVAAQLVLSDVVMPGGWDGLDLAQAMREEGWPIPVLLYSGYGGAPARVAAAGLPLLRKPFSLPELERAVLLAFRERQGEEKRAAG
ncbi:ATP-binding protein [Siccirubricoccus phaeus]|uniref:ATP-binding protein n=1 Tax=Siccirubricoccus phaeus TaxID=2595053 RepID=UPI00165BC8D5|nr:ATP-binding protein [Siccirubricoccus phaeus]